MLCMKRDLYVCMGNSVFKYMDNCLSMLVEETHYLNVLSAENTDIISHIIRSLQEDNEPKDAISLFCYIRLDEWL